MKRLRKEEREALPFLMAVGSVNYVFDTNRYQLKHLYPQLHLLNMPGGTRRFPRAYILGLYDFARTERMEPGRMATVRAFAGSVAAKQTIETTEAKLEQDLTKITDQERRRISAVGVANVLCINRMSINDWAKTGAITTFHDGKPLYVPVDSIRSTLSWQRPEGFVPAPKNLLLPTAN